MTPMRYFELLDDVSIPGRWELDDPTDPNGQEIADPWMFRQGVPVQVEERLKIPLSRPGLPLDFSFAGIGVTPVVHEKVASLLARLAPGDVQILPVEVASQSESYFLVNVIQSIKCINDETSGEVKHWRPEDGRPEKVGKYRAVSGLRIDPSKVGGAQIFRTWGWTIPLIVSESIKETLEHIGVTGVKFKEVSGPSITPPEERERNRKLLQLREQTDTAREAFWRTLGELDEEVIVPIVVGGSWPAQRQVWRVIHRPERRTLLVTDGLSDFFVDQSRPSVGFGLELVLETDEPLSPLEKSWALLLLERVADEVVKHERVRERVRTDLMSMEVSGSGMPESLVTVEGRVGVLLGLEPRGLPPQFSLPTGDVRLVTVKTLLPPELNFLLANGKKGRDELMRRFMERNEAHLSQARRLSVV